MRVIYFLIMCGAISLAPVGQTNAGYCEFMLYSDFLGRSLKVCQSASMVEDCGVWPSVSQSSRAMAVAEGKDRGLLQLQRGECPLERAVGSCQLPANTLVFYEGKLEYLAKGCSQMQGIWTPATTAREIR